MSMNNRKTVLSFAFSLPVMIAVFITGCGNVQEEKNNTPVSVRVIDVQLLPESEGTDYVGTIEESFGTTLSFETAEMFSICM